MPITSFKRFDGDSILLRRTWYPESWRPVALTALAESLRTNQVGREGTSMCDSRRESPRRYNKSDAGSEKNSNRHSTEVHVSALAKKEFERRLRYFAKLRHA
jgi:hypothetical protein